ncbi:hypothetical protein BCU68_11925 [Vibrio sp. 10N.286.49.B3]|uniref:nitrogenase-stabilizing/protective protein NifW n=1 Tax=Vibrio sp. 10N.286.49.B3 TaxID=1880855 RepID=UPI000C85D1CA|nr:nitrogenase-stabilizing/protective protein NifW [Vibrio sp. 10N.286.49.B3]PMH44846.1 hypothetical protein BCU68_11925 [Vibrio sp. 10N.286.49.B3]
MNDRQKQQISALSSAEDFCEYFGIEYSKILLQTKRIPLLRMYHYLLASMEKETEHSFTDYQKALRIAYRQIEKGNELAFNPSNCDGCSDCD